jgi:hypothetical protein
MWQRFCRKGFKNRPGEKVDPANSKNSYLGSPNSNPMLKPSNGEVHITDSEEQAALPGN